MKQNKKKDEINWLSDLFLTGNAYRKKRFGKGALIILCLFLMSIGSYAQINTAVTGTVKDENGVTLPGANVLEKGTTNGVSSDFDGNFKITLQTDDATLIVSFVGYLSKEISVNGQSNIIASLTEDLSRLDEVVVIGYGTTTKKEITGAVATVSEEEFTKGDMTNPLNLIQGKVAGLSIVRSNGGDPNSDFQVRLRGLNSLSGGKSPLIVVDGVISSNALNMIDPNEIKSMDVLKDGSAAAIYGTRATNGVILITTKNPVADKLKFEFNTFLSTQIASEDNRYLSPSEYRNTLNERYPDLAANLDKGSSTNAFDEVTRSPINQYYSFTTTGGNGNMSFRANLYFKDNQGLVKNSASRTITPSIFLKQSAFDNKLNIDYRLMYSDIKSAGSNNSVISEALTRNPTQPIYDPTDLDHGGYYTVVTAIGFLNPVAMVNERIADIKSNNLLASVNASYELMEGLKLRLSGNYNSRDVHRGTYYTRYYPNLGADGQAYLSTDNNYNILFEPDVEYSKTIGNHSFKLLAGYSYFENVNEGFSMDNYNFDGDEFTYNNIGTGYALNEGLASMGSYKNSNKLIGFYNRLSYNFKNKYLLSASLRYEGSSRFGKNNKWGTFPAISAGWQIHEEDFMQDVSWLTNLKLRVGYGVTGNQDIPNYLSLERLQVSQRQFYLDGQWVNAYQPASNPNPDLKWEKKTEYNIGLDFGMFDSRLYGNIEFYKRNISDLLWWYSVPVPPNVFDTIYANVGEMTNQGIEIQLNYEPFKSKDFSWVTSVNFSKNNNKMVTFSNQGLGYELEFLKMTPAASTWSQLVREGDPVGNWVAPVFEGVDDNGNAIYKDVNGDGNIDIQSEEDREVVGNQYPDFDLSWNNNFRYKNFDLSVFFRGSFGQDALNYERMFYESWNPFLAGGNVLKSTLTNNPDYTGIQVYDSRFVEDASYLKLDNLTLGYNLELSKATTLRLYFTGQNLFTITNYSGADPEKAIGDINTSTETSGNSNLNYYPFTRTYLLGVNFKF